MANLIRVAKSGSDWGPSDLDAFNISIIEQDEETFFDGPLPAYKGPAGFIQRKGPIGVFQQDERIDGLDKSSLALIKRLDLAINITGGEESAVVDFAAEVLRAMDYEAETMTVCTRKDIRFIMCGEPVYAKTDVFVLDLLSEILLLVQEDKSHIRPQDPESQLIAGAIATFQFNNAKRVNDFLFQDPLPTMVIPGITMTGTFPKFYKIKVTADLDRCVRYGQFPTVKTIVYRHTPRVPGRRSDGMRPLDNREHILRCYEGFRSAVTGCKDLIPLVLC